MNCIKVLVNEKEEIGMEEKEEKNVENINDTGALREFIEALITDEDMKTRFIDNPDEVMKDYDLNESQRLLLKSLDEEDVAKLSPENVEEYFSADSAVYTPDIDEELLESNEQEEQDLL